MSDLLLNLAPDLFETLRVRRMFCKYVCSKHPPYSLIGNLVQIKARLVGKADQRFLKLKLYANLFLGIHGSSPMPDYPGASMVSGRTTASNSSAVTWPERRASSFRVVPFLCAALAMAAALS